MWRRYFSKSMQDAFDRAKRKNNAISLRAYARHIQTSPGTLSEILHDQRKIPAKRALAIAERAKLEETVMTQLRRLIGDEQIPRDRKTLSAAAVDLIVNPVYYRVLCALEVLPIPSTVPQLANYLELDEKKLKSVLELLEQVEVVKMKGVNVYWLGQYVITPPDVPSGRVQGFFKENLKESAQGLSIPVDQREYTTVTFAADEANLPKAKEQIRSFRDHLSDSMAETKPNRIYELSIQLRPVSKKYTE